MVSDGRKKIAAPYSVKRPPESIGQHSNYLRAPKRDLKRRGPPRARRASGCAGASGLGTRVWHPSCGLSPAHSRLRVIVSHSILAATTLCFPLAPPCTPGGRASHPTPATALPRRLAPPPPPPPSQRLRACSPRPPPPRPPAAPAPPSCSAPRSRRSPHAPRPRASGTWEG